MSEGIRSFLLQISNCCSGRNNVSYETEMRFPDNGAGRKLYSGRKRGDSLHYDQKQQLGALNNSGSLKATRDSSDASPKESHKRSRRHKPDHLQIDTDL
mmetsp:Transcript_49262/g.56597  ORF Transcript_49262/g.56597 Transcript_49262/m.56597 type:complete len:99 (-) Transcript_49262:442-738(-)